MAEEALSPRSIEARVYHTRHDPMCRLCKDDPGSIQHITGVCKMLIGRACMKCLQEYHQEEGTQEAQEIPRAESRA